MEAAMNEHDVTQAVVLTKALIDTIKSAWNLVSTRQTGDQIPVYRLVARSKNFDDGAIGNAVAGSTPG